MDNQEEPTEILAISDIKTVKLDSSKKHKGCATFNVIMSNGDILRFCGKDAFKNYEWVRVFLL